MPKVKRPKRGSRAFYPRKRAKRSYPRVKSYASTKDAIALGFSGYKAGMTHVMMIQTNPNKRTKGQQVWCPVTIIDCPPLSVFGFTAYEMTTSGLRSITTTYSDKLHKNIGRKIKVPKKADENSKKLEGKKIREVRLVCHTNPGFKKRPEVFEIPIGGDVDKQLEYAKNMLGKDIKVSDIFKETDFIDVSGVSKGKGFQGVVKRFGTHILTRNHQQMARKLAPHGTRWPGKVRPTVPQAGQHGFQTRTEYNKRILKIGSSDEFTPSNGFLKYGKLSGDALMVEGSIVGPAKRMIRMRSGIRAPKTKHPVDLRYVSLDSKQGV